MSMAVAYGMKKKNKMAEGGGVAMDEKSGYGSLPEEREMENGPAMSEDNRDLNQHGEDEEGPQGARMAEGGFIGSHQSEEHMEDMVGRIMKMRQKMYSKGGEIANEGEANLGRMADSHPNNFDDLSMRDDLESSYTGENSGDNLGNDRTDEDERDLVAQIMKSRAKKDRLPNPR